MKFLRRYILDPSDATLDAQDVVLSWALIAGVIYLCRAQFWLAALIFYGELRHALF